MQRLARCGLRAVTRSRPMRGFGRLGQRQFGAPAAVTRRWMSSSSAHPALSMWSEEENILRDTVARVAREEVGPLVSKMDREAQMDAGLIRTLFNEGLMGVEVPVEYGGSEMSFTQACVVIEELGKVDPAVGVMVDIQNTLANTSFMRFGTEEQKKEYLPRLATESLASFCLSEASCGSDAFALKTRADKKGDSYVINGSKMWISNSAEADIFVVFANVDFDKGYKGITAFVVERGTDGMTVGKKEDKLGIRASSTCEISFEDVVVPKANVLGHVGEGYKIAIGLLNEGRIGIGALLVGLAQGALDATIPYTKQREAFGVPISKFQGMQFNIAQAATDIEAARLMVYNTARLKDAGVPFIKQAAMAKLFASQVAQRVASQCVELVGGVGFTKEFPQEKFFRDAQVGPIVEGTTALQLQTIAQLLLAEYD